MKFTLESLRQPSIDTVRQMLANAVTIELATLPVYLTGVFSVMPGANAMAKALVQSVAVEEMLHVTLAANTLIAVGGTPEIKTWALSLSYPTALPGGVDPDLTVGIAPMTRQQVYDVYMGIEWPDTKVPLPGDMPAASPLRLLAAKPAKPAKPAEDYLSISDFYTAIIDQLEMLAEIDPDLFADPRCDLQLDISGWLPSAVPGVPDGKVTSLATAKAVIQTIMREGEGVVIDRVPIDPMGGMKGSFAHFFKFGEIYYGQRLIPDPEDPSGWAYAGDDVPLDPTGIYNLLPDAALSDYRVGTAAWVAGQQFHDTYVRLLTALDQSFRGRAQSFDSAMGLMYELKLAADRVVLFPADETKPDGYIAAPPFQLSRSE